MATRNTTYLGIPALLLSDSEGDFQFSRIISPLIARMIVSEFQNIETFASENEGLVGDEIEARLAAKQARLESAQED